MPMCTNPAPRHNDVPPRPPQRSGRVMPESADEAMMASDDIRDDAMALLAKAAALWAEGGVEGGSTAPPGCAGRPRARPGGRRPDRLRHRVLPARRPRGPDRGRTRSAGRDGRQARRARREPPAGPSRRGRPPGPVKRRGRWRPHQRRDRRRHRHRRHAVPGRLRDDGAQPARGRHPADRAPGAHRAQGRGGHGPRDRPGRRRVGQRVVDPRRARPGRGRAAAGRRPAPRPR